MFDRTLQAKQAFDHLNGFHLQERYLVGELPAKADWLLQVRPIELTLRHPANIVLYHKQERLANKADLARREKELEEQKKRHNITEDD